jgi:hypothetical protein
MEVTMKRSWLKYLAFIGLLGLLGVLTPNKGYLGFFGFFGFVGLGAIPKDERLEKNINKASRNAFFAAVIFFVLSIIASAFTPDLSIFITAFIVNFVLQLFVFVISLRVYDWKG